MYLTRAAGIETLHARKYNRIRGMYLTRAAGIETYNLFSKN